MDLYIWLVTFGLYSLSFGQNVEFQYDSKCYEETDTMTVTATYIPSGAATVDFVKWYYSGQVGTLLIIDATDCSVFGSVPAGYPVSTRMSYDCPSTNTNLNANTFKLSLTGLTEEELHDSWGATFTLSVGADPTVVQELIQICTTTSTTSIATTTKASATTSIVPTSTSTTSISPSTTITSVSKSTTHTSASAIAISRTSATPSITEAKPETTTISGDSSSKETVVIIVASVVGGLFVVGIVITIILMLLSQRKRRKLVSKGIHTMSYEENKDTWQYQRSKSPSSLGHPNHGYMSSRHQFRQIPLFVRQSNTPVTYQYQPWNGNYRRSLNNYPGLSGGEQYRSGYVVQDRRGNKAPNDYNPDNLRQQYYSHPHNPQKSFARNPNRETCIYW